MPTELVPRVARRPSLLPICLVIALYAVILVAKCRCGDMPKDERRLRRARTHRRGGAEPIEVGLCSACSHEASKAKLSKRADAFETPLAGSVESQPARNRRNTSSVTSET